MGTGHSESPCLAERKGRLALINILDTPSGQMVGMGPRRA